MDKYEYKVRSEEIVQLINEENYEEAAAIADGIDWRRVKSLTMLLRIAALYRINRRHEDSRAILLLAYDRYPSNRSVVSELCEVCIELSDVVAAIEYYKEFARIAPRDNGVYTLRYRILEAQEASLEERIQLLEELKKRDYQEEWAYELAYLYHRVGLGTKCVEECDDLILWFGDGPYVIKAMELKMLHAPLTSIQEKNYRNMIGAVKGIPQENIEKEEYQVIQEETEYPAYKTKQPMEYEEQQEEIAYSQDYYAEEATTYEQEQVAYEYASEQDYGDQENELYAGESYRDEEMTYAPEAEQTNGDAYCDNRYVDLSQYNTINLQKVVADSMKELFPEDTDLYEENKREVEALDEASGRLRDTLQEIEDKPQEQEEVAEEIVPEIRENVINKMLTGVSEMAPAPNTGAIKKVILPDGGMMNLTEKKEEAVAPKEEIIQQPVYTDYETVKSTEEEVPFRPMTGQMNIEDVLLEWERMKRENEEKRKQEIKNLVQQQTGKLFENFDQASKSGILAGLDLESDQVPDFAEYHVETFLEEESDELSTGIDEQNAIATESEYGEVEELAEEPEYIEPEYGEVEELAEEPEYTEPEYGEVEELAEEPEYIESEYGEVEELAEEPEYNESEYGEVEALVEEAEYNESEYGEVEELVEEAEYNESEYGEVEELTEESEYNEVEEIEEENEESVLRTQEFDMSTADMSSLQDKIIETTQKETKGVKREEIRDFSEEEKEYFEDYAVTKKIKKQIIHTIDHMTLTSCKGNVLITGETGIGKIKLAKNLVRDYKNLDADFSGKVAKITGEQLNLREMKTVFDKLNHGALIIENANEMTKETSYNMVSLLNRKDFGIIIIMTDTKKGITKLLNKQAMLADYFNLRIDLMEMDNNALVAYAKSYAQALEYSIDELGTLALHTRISNIQSGNHIVTKDEVREIIDEAIYRSSRPRIKNIFGAIFSKKYDKDDMIVLRERDFM